VTRRRRRPLRDEKAREGVPQVVEAKPRRGDQPSSIDGGIKAAANDIAIVQRSPVESAEDEVLWPRLA
jgi:hypothetical protein